MKAHQRATHKTVLGQHPSLANGNFGHTHFPISLCWPECTSIARTSAVAAASFTAPQKIARFSWGPSWVKMGESLSANFREEDEDSNFSGFRVRQFTEWSGPLHWIAFPVEILTKPLIHWMPSPFSREKCSKCFVASPSRNRLLGNFLAEKLSENRYSLNGR